MEFILDDLTEFKRILVFLILSLGLLNMSSLDYPNVRVLQFLVVSLIIMHFADIHLYSHKLRMSGFLQGVNYSWVTVWYIMISSYSKGSTDKLLGYILSTVVLVMSGSFTSILVFVMFITILERARVFRLIATLLIGGLIFAQVLHFLPLRFQFIKNKMLAITSVIQSGSLLEIPSFAHRWEVWQRVVKIAYNKPVFGHGSAKAIVRYVDNQYLLTFFRWGFVGLFLEISILIVVLRMSWRIRNKGVFIFICGLFLAGLTSNVLVELKIMYILPLLISYVRENSGFHKESFQ